MNGGGKAEVQAAQIQPVEDRGPDIVNNGIALSATCNWLFDCHHISIKDNYSLLVAQKLKLPLMAVSAPPVRRNARPAD